MKHKSKQKFGCECQIELRPKQRRYGAVVRLAEEVPQAIKLPAGVIAKQARWTGKSLVLGAALKGQAWQVEEPGSGADRPDDAFRIITMLLLSGYHVLGLARVMSKDSGAA
jgi:hypothetical protein